MLKKNISFSLLTNISRLFLGLLVFILLSRIFDLEVFGKYIYLIVITGYFSIFTDFGFNLSVLNDLPRNKEKVKNFFYEILFSKTILMIISFILFFIFIWLSAEISELYIFLIFMIVAMFQSYSSLLSHIFKAFNRFDRDFYYTIITNLCLLPLIYIYQENLDLYKLGIFLLISRIVGLLYLLYMFNVEFVNHKIIGTMDFNLNPLKKNIKYAVHMIIGGLLLSIDIPIMKEILTLKDVAIYSAGMKIFVALILISDVLNASFMPKLSEYIKQDYELFEQLAQKLTLMMFLLGTIFALLIMLLGQPVVLIIYGDKYASLISLLPYFSLALFIRYLSMVYGMLVTLAGKQHIRATVIAIVFFIHIFLNIFFQKSLGIEGALISFCISFSFVTIISMLIVSKEYGRLFVLPIKYKKG